MSPAGRWEGRPVLVTGGKGFVGSHLAERLVGLGADVTVLDADLTEQTGANDHNVARFADDVRLVEGDVRDADTVREVVDGVDVVFHLAAQVSRVRASERPRLDAEVNCVGTLTVLEAARDADRDPRVVFTGSRAASGSPPSLPVTEATPDDPVDVYGVDKLAAEQYCHALDGDGLSAVVARPTNVYGPRAQVHDTNYGVVNVFVRKAVEDEVLTVFEPGTMRRDCVYVADVVDALLRLADEPAVGGETFLVGSAEAPTIRELAERIVEAAGRGSVELVEWPDDWDGLRVGDFVVDPSKLRERTGWRADVGLDRGLRRTVAFYERHLDRYV